MSAARIYLRYVTAPRAGVYVLILVAAVLTASTYSFRQHTLFVCPASGYEPDSYLAYCGSSGYGDYDYGAFWFGLEPEAARAAARADVLFVGNSRTQYALSSGATRQWFEAAGTTHFLLGFAYDGNYRFAEPLLRKLRPAAGVYVLNLDLFFEADPTPPARIVMEEGDAEARYRRKKEWQELHASLCSKVPLLCGQEAAFFRSRVTGAWRQAGRQFKGDPVSFDDRVDERRAQAYIESGKTFLASLPVPRDCLILTVVPTVNTPLGTSRAIATALGKSLVAPQLPALQTFDGSHLDPASAELWSSAFFDEAGPTIRRCLHRQADGSVASSVPR